MNARPPYQPNFPSNPPPGAPPSPVAATPREKIARVRTLARRALAYWKVSAVILGVGMVVSLYFALNVKLIYRSECTILFKPAMHTGDRDDEGPKAKQVGEKLKDVLTTRTRLEALIKQYELYPKLVDSRGIVDAVEEMRVHIGFRARDSETFVISFENEGQETARQVTTSLAESMINEFTNSSVSTAKQERDFLLKQEQRSGAAFEAANKELATFLTIHPEFAVEAKMTAFGAGAGSPLQPAVPMMPNMPKDSAQTMGDGQLGVLFREKARLEAELRNNSAGGAAPTPGPTPGGDESIPKLTLQRDQAAKAAAAAAADLANKRTRLTDEHPDVISAKLTAEGAARQLHQAEVALAFAQAGSGNPYDAPLTDANVQRRINQLNAAIAARQDAVRHAQPVAAGTDASATAGAPVGETNELVQLETEWQRLLSVLLDTRSEHEDLQRRLDRARLTANAAEATGGDQMMVIDPAYRPMHPTKGGRSKTAMMGGAVSLILALAYAFARVVFNDTIIDSADIESMQLIPVLGVLPRVRPVLPPPATRPATKDIQRVV